MACFFTPRAFVHKPLEDVVPVPVSRAEGHEVRQGHGDQRPELEVPKRPEVQKDVSRAIWGEWNLMVRTDYPQKRLEIGGDFW